MRHLLAATLAPATASTAPASSSATTDPPATARRSTSTRRSTRSATGISPPRSLRDLIARVNRIRNEQLALHTTAPCASTARERPAARLLQDHPRRPRARPHDPASQPGAVRREPRSARIAGRQLDLDLVALGVDPARPFQVHDLLTDQRYTWQGNHPYVELDPNEQPGHVLRVEPAAGRARARRRARVRPPTAPDPRNAS